MTKFPSRRTVVLAYPDVQILDVVGPLQVFSHSGYPVEIIGVEAGPIRTSSGMQLVAERGIGEVADGIDTLLVAGGTGFPGPAGNPAGRTWGVWLRSVWLRNGCRNPVT